MGRVDGKVVLVTGAAGGLGRADAELLAAEGATVVLTDVNSEGGEAIAAGIRSTGGKAEFLEQDVASEERWVEVIAHIRERYGRLDVLVNNAGIVRLGNPEDCTLEDFRRQNAIMNDGVFLACKHALGLMAESGGGSIINMSSIASHLGYPIYFAYGAAKGAVRTMTKALAVHCQLNGYNIRVNSLHPGAIDTPMVEQSRVELGVEKTEDLSPVVGVGEPSDVANVVLFLASDESRFVNGSEILIDNALAIQ